MSCAQSAKPEYDAMTPHRPAPKLWQSALPLFDSVTAAQFPNTQLRYRNDAAAASVGLDHLSDSDWLRHFAQFDPLPENQPVPIALRYHGHQFRHYNPDLGDGRGFLFAQMFDEKDRLLDLGTKGSGTTPYSRGGDGRLTLKGGVREVLATAMLQALGVPTSKSFSLIETFEPLQRGDEPSPTRSSVLVRLSHSHIRFGTFERLAYLNETETMSALVDYISKAYFADRENAAGLFDDVVRASARLVARWMVAGFVHGVLNTDNMNITGESFDYGPYRFLPYYTPLFTAAYFDHGRLYAYDRQPDAVLWNLGQLGRCFAMIVESAPLVESFNGFGELYQAELGLALCDRLNLKPNDDNSQLISSFYALAEGLRSDGSFEGIFFDWFGGATSLSRAAGSPRAKNYAGPEFETFFGVLATYATADPKKLDHPRFAQDRPETLLIDEIEAIWLEIATEDDWSGFYKKLKAIAIYGEAMAL